MKWLISFLFLSVSIGSMAQAVSARAWSYKGGEVRYSYYAPEAGYSTMILGFYASDDQAWQYATWGQELSWLGEKRNAIVMAPEANAPRIDSIMLRAWAASISDSLDPGRSRFVTLGAGVSQIGGLLEFGVPGLVIAPTDSLPTGSIAEDMVVGVIDSRKGDSSKVVIEQLERAGAWVFSKMVVGDDPYYFDGHKEVMTYLFQKLDSMTAVLNDSLKRSQIRSRITKEGPDLLRQGKPFETEVFIAEEGWFEIEILNLSAKSVYKREVFLGKGKHTITLPTGQLDWGVYKVEVDGPGIIVKQKIMIRG